jgi:hypothetical protein
VGCGGDVAWGTVSVQEQSSKRIIEIATRLKKLDMRPDENFITASSVIKIFKSSK